MKRKTIILLMAVAVAAGALFYFYGGHATPKGQQALVSFSSGDLTSLKSNFNGSPSSVRVLLMLSPT
jgi:hypothetical protein